MLLCQNPIYPPTNTSFWWPPRAARFGNMSPICRIVKRFGDINVIWRLETKPEILNFKNLPTFHQNWSRIAIFTCTIARFFLAFVVFGFQLRQNVFSIEKCFWPMWAIQTSVPLNSFELNQLSLPKFWIDSTLDSRGWFPRNKISSAHDSNIFSRN